MISSWHIISLVIMTSLISLGQGFFLFSKKQNNFDRSGPSNNHQWQPYSTRSEALWSNSMSGSSGQGPPTFTFDASAGPMTVALPVAVPIQAQMSTAALQPPAHSPPPAATLHNVQLVPCLCPVTKDFEPAPSPMPTASPSSPSYVFQNSSPP